MAFTPTVAAPEPLDGSTPAGDGGGDDTLHPLVGDACVDGFDADSGLLEQVVYVPVDSPEGPTARVKMPPDPRLQPVQGRADVDVTARGEYEPP